MEAFKFTPYLKSVIWGGEKIAALKHITVDHNDIGESWELSGVPGNETCVAEGPDRGLKLSELIDKYKSRLVGQSVYTRYGNQFPLLIKIIDARRDLSVQVHPNDALARQRHGCAGKTEMWYILDSEPGAKIYAGLANALTPDTYRRAVEQNSIMQDIAVHESHPGDIFFLPAGRIHAIGAGNLLLEIQQTSDITYRIYDYNRTDSQGNPRQLHTELAADAIDYTVYPDYKSKSQRLSACEKRLASCEYFDVKLINVNGEYHITDNNDTFLIITCTAGNITITCDDSTTQLAAGDTLLIPAERTRLIAEGLGDMVVSTAL